MKKGRCSRLTAGEIIVEEPGFQENDEYRLYHYFELGKLAKKLVRSR
jgi:hypothetical protein